MYLCSWEEKSSLSCSLNWKKSLSSALTPLLQTSTAPRVRRSLKLWDSSGSDLSFSKTLHTAHLMPQVELTQIWRFISSFSQFHTQFSHATFTVGSLNSSGQKMRDPFPSRAVICARTSWAGLQGELGISGDFYAMGTHLCTAEEDPESQD